MGRGSVGPRPESDAGPDAELEPRSHARAPC